MENHRPFNGVAPSVDETVWVDPTALVIGDVAIGKHSSLWPFAVARGDVNRIRIGHHTNIQDHSMLHVSHAGPYNPDGAALTIGDEVTVGHRVILHGCDIGNRCLIGMGAILMGDVTVETQVVVGAGALVPPGKTLRSGFLYVGSPARQVRALAKEEREHLVYSARHYARLADRHRGSHV